MRRRAAPVVSASLVGILLFIGATGKSAQIPLHVWLPDAMAGPTPVSALIHAATMVTAGVYLVARMSGVYMHAPEASQVDRRRRRRPPPSSPPPSPSCRPTSRRCSPTPPISQLGFMFLALGVGAYGVAIFHVVTHAFFKACLFLGAGSVIHALARRAGHAQDGRAARARSRSRSSTFAVATAAIAGIPPLAGFFSKDEILWYAFASSRGGSPLLWGVAALTALLTAFYMFRLLWLAFLGASRMEPKVEHHVHESPLSMTGVLVVLALCRRWAAFSPCRTSSSRAAAAARCTKPRSTSRRRCWSLSVVLALAGLAGAAFVFGGDAARADALCAASPALHRCSSASTSSTNSTTAVSARPLTWISENVFLRIGDRAAGRHAERPGRLGTAAGWRVEPRADRQPAPVRLLVLLGIVGAVLWSWRHV